MGWDSKKSGYDGLIEVANRLMMKGTSNSDTVEAAVLKFVSLCLSFHLPKTFQNLLVQNVYFN